MSGRRESTGDSISDRLVWDAHAGIFPDPELDFTQLSAWRDAGVDYVSLNVGFDVMDWQATLQTLAAYRYRLREFEDVVVIAARAQDIVRAREDGKLAVSFDIEGANALNGDLSMVSAYYDLGIRQMLLAYNLGNDAAGGCHDIDDGLTAFGRDVVREMNRVGMIVD
ncbi:MAG: membrane dipeptidase, partial [Hyphomicrobiales bacterium]|nr:membrane dipeptidase [Hyphomicrobiales bacterium]